MKMIKSRRIRQAGLVACMGDVTDAYKIFVRRPERKSPLRRARHKGKEKIIQKLSKHIT
jgi:hypothetical protein